MKVLLHPCYFGSISFWLTVINANQLVLEVCDNYQKQTQRNRCNILAANGILTLTVPVNFSQKNRTAVTDVQIASSNWQSQHLKSLNSAYKMSPFYEYYIDDIAAIVNREYPSLLELNISSVKLIAELLELPLSYKVTRNYRRHPIGIIDSRYLVKKNSPSPYKLKEYTQVYTYKYGFKPDLCILDLLFNEGPNTENFLRKHLPV